jgi:RNA polymerase sigma factor (sigma-70 family)
MRIEKSWAALLPRLEADVRLRATGFPNKDNDAWNSALFLLRAYGRVLARSFSDLRQEHIDDIVQETLIKLQSPRTLQRLRITGSPAGYVAVMMRNAATDLMRQRQRGQEVEISWADELSVHETIEGQLVSSERTEQLRVALLFLSPEERKLLRMRFWGDLGIAEIAEQSGLSYSAAAVRLFRILHKLREKIRNI